MCAVKPIKWIFHFIPFDCFRIDDDDSDDVRAHHQCDGDAMVWMIFLFWCFKIDASIHTVCTVTFFVF